MILFCYVFSALAAVVSTDPAASMDFNYHKINDDIYESSVNFMASKKLPHSKDETIDMQARMDPGIPYDFTKFQEYLNENGNDRGESLDHNRIKRRAKTVHDALNGPKIRERPHHYAYPEPVKDTPLVFTTSTKRPSVLPEHMNAGVIFRVRMSDAILRIKQRMYEDPERHIEADIIYTNLIKKVVTDEITKFHNLLLMYKTDRSIKEHLGECGGRIYKFISYMTIKVHIYCLFDALWIDGTPYVIGDEYSVTPVEVPPMLQCDASECNSIVFVDSITEPKDVDE